MLDILNKEKGYGIKKFHSTDEFFQIKDFIQHSFNETLKYYGKF